VTPLTLSSPTKASLFWIILWRCCGAAEHGIARLGNCGCNDRDQQAQFQRERCSGRLGVCYALILTIDTGGERFGFFLPFIDVARGQTAHFHTVGVYETFSGPNSFRTGPPHGAVLKCPVQHRASSCPRNNPPKSDCVFGRLLVSFCRAAMAVTGRVQIQPEPAGTPIDR
jgi:hypothetical protein